MILFKKINYWNAKNSENVVKADYENIDPVFMASRQANVNFARI